MMRAVTFHNWFHQHWRQEGESVHRALTRLCLHADLSLPTLKQALNGRAVAAKTAQTLSTATDGKVLPGPLAWPEGAA